MLMYANVSIGAQGNYSWSALTILLKDVQFQAVNAVVLQHSDLELFTVTLSNLKLQVWVRGA